VLAFGDEAIEVLLRLADRIRLSDANDVKTLRARLARERALDPGAV